MSGGGGNDEADVEELRERVADLEQLLEVQERVVVAQTTALRQNEARLRLLFDKSPIAKVLFDPTTFRLLAVNESVATLYGYTREELLGMRLTDLKVDDADPEFRDGMTLLRQSNATAIRHGRFHGTKQHRRKDGSVIQVDVTADPVTLDGRVAMLAAFIDVTEKRQLEQQLRHAQKMEAVGQLAGGIAHDFNNLLSVILSYATLLLQDLPAEDPIREDITEVKNAGERAARLTKQLLAFSRKQILAPKRADLNELLGGMEKLLRPLLGETVALAVTGTADLGKVFIDRGQIEQVVVNLVVNARDACDPSGQITIETANVFLDETHAKAHPGVSAGSFVRMSVTDSGSGIDPAVLGRIFEPFFTTKGKEKGTGLGLSTVFGIVEQSGGHIDVRSEPGKGTQFDVYFPRVDEVNEDPRSSTGAQGPPSSTVRGAETILVVEDEDQVRRSVRAILARQGYAVLEAQNGGEAFMICERHNGPIDLLVTDVVMPVMNGREVAERLAPMRPQMKVLYMSGYTEDSIVKGGALEGGIAYLPKPITVEALVRKVRDILLRS